MATSRLWFARLVAVYACLIFGFLASLYVFWPLDHIARFGVSATGSPESINFLRAGPGALFLANLLFAVHGLARPARLRSSLAVLVVLNGCVVAVRLFCIAVDGVSPLHLSELRDEGLSWLLFVGALWLCPNRSSTSG